MTGHGRTALLATLLAGLMLGPSLQAQQEGEPVSIGTYRLVHSKILDEDRALLIHLPPGYERSTASYPVIYMLYGDHVTTYFADAVSAVDALGPSGRTPEFILVGVMNTDRYRDLLPESQGRPTGISAFIRFLNDELFTFVEKSYRTKPYRILVGPQAGGNFALYALMNRPGMFNGFIIETPFRWRGGRDMMLDMALPFLRDCRQGRRFMHITYRRMDDLEKEGLPYLERFGKMVQDSGCREFRLELDFASEEDDFVLPLHIRQGLKKLFDSYPFPDDLRVDSLGDILAWYGKRSAEYGFEVDVPAHVLAMQSDSLMQKGMTEQMIEVLHFMLEKDPSSGNALWRLGNHYERTGEPGKAIEYYERMLAVMGSDAGMVRSRIDALKSRLEQPQDAPQR